MLRLYLKRVERFRYRTLLGLLLVVLVLHAVSASSGTLRLLLLATTGLLFVGALHATDRSTGLANVGTVVTLVWLVLKSVQEWGVDGLVGISLFASIVLVVLVAWCTFSALFLEGKADIDSLSGAIFGYFLLAILWAALFDGLETWSPGSFELTAAGTQSEQLFYLSLVTITTLGYGDVLPISAEARILAGLEAMIGPLYLAVLIGRIVSALKPTA